MEFERSRGGILLPKHDQLVGHGCYHFEHIRKGEIIDAWDEDNLVVNQGLNYLLGVALKGTTPVTNWYLGIFQGNYAPVATDTGANVAANSTECSSYTSATRPLWQAAAPSSQNITNSANPAVFTFNASVTIYGAFLISDATIGSSSGSDTLWGEAAFAAAKAVNNLDQLLVTYGFTASSS